MSRSRNILSVPTEFPARGAVRSFGTQCWMCARTCASASARVVPESNSSSSPDSGCISWTTSNVSSLAPAGGSISRSSPGESRSSSESVTMTAISIRASSDRSSPVISQSIQTMGFALGGTGFTLTCNILAPPGRAVVRWAAPGSVEPRLDGVDESGGGEHLILRHAGVDPQLVCTLRGLQRLLVLTFVEVAAGEVLVGEGAQVVRVGAILAHRFHRFYRGEGLLVQLACQGELALPLQHVGKPNRRGDRRERQRLIERIGAAARAARAAQDSPSEFLCLIQPAQDPQPHHPHRFAHEALRLEMLGPCRRLVPVGKNFALGTRIA